MPTYRVTAPDGRVLKITAPEGATQDEIIAYAAANAPASAGPTAQEPAYNPTEGMGTIEKMLAGMAAGVDTLRMGAGQMIPGLVSQESIQERERLNAPLMDTTAGTVGKYAGKIGAPVLAAMMAPGASTVAGGAAIGALTGLLEPVAQGDVATGKATQGLLGAVLGAGGQKVGNMLGGKLAARGANKAAAAEALRVANATKDATTRAGQQLGYTVPPTHANPSMVNRVLEGAAGKLTTGQLAAENNQAVTDLIAKRAIGMADDAPLTVEAVQAVRKSAGGAYEALKKFGGRFAADNQYLDDLVNVTTDNAALSREFPEVATKSLDDFVSSFAKQDFSPTGAVEAIKKLRADASVLFRSDDPQKIALARASKGVANAMESVIERNLQQSGDDALLASYRAARELIAKTHTIEDAMNEGSGHVVARKLAGQLSRGKPLSGDLKEAARFAQVYPKATQEVTSSMPGISPLDFYGAGGASVVTGNPLPLLYPLARMGVRKGILSPAYQAAMTTPKYSGGGLEQMLGGLLGKKSTPALASMLGPLIYGSQQ